MKNKELENLLATMEAKVDEADSFSFEVVWLKAYLKAGIRRIVAKGKRYLRFPNENNEKISRKDVMDALEKHMVLLRIISGFVGQVSIDRRMEELCESDLTEEKIDREVAEDARKAQEWLKEEVGILEKAIEEADIENSSMSDLLKMSVFGPDVFFCRTAVRNLYAIISRLGEMEKHFREGTGFYWETGDGYGRFMEMNEIEEILMLAEIGVYLRSRPSDFAVTA